MDNVYVRAGDALESGARETDYKRRLHIAAAAVLGINTDELEKAFANGQTIRQIAEARGIDMAVIRFSLKKVHQSQIQQAIDNGELTQEQADMLQNQVSLAPWLSDDHYISCVMIGF